MRKLKFVSILTLSLLALAGTSVIHAGKNRESEQCAPFVIPPGTKLNEYNLILVHGQDDNLEAPATIAPTLAGFTDMLGWDENKINDYRQAAVDWFLERFGIDFNGGILDPQTGILFGPNFNMAMVPALYHGVDRVLFSTKKSLPAYCHKHPSSVAVALYVVAFFETPVYGGTFAHGTPITGDISDNLAYSTYRIFLNCEGTKFETIFGRSFYPTTTTPNRFPTITPSTLSDREQLFSLKYGAGYNFVNSRGALSPINGVFPSNATSTMLFPGSNLEAYNDWNGFQEAPVIP